MKAVLIIYNQAHTEKVEYMLSHLEIRGFTGWQNLTGRGTTTGDPHMGTHTWPETNSATITIVEDDKVEYILKGVKSLDEINTDVGIRAFVWDVLQQVP